MSASQNFNRTLEWIEKNVKNDISAIDIANYSGYSLYHFSRLFTRNYKISPMRYLSLRKLQYALYDLSKGKKIIDVALAYGYNSPEGFTKAFKNKYGFLPSQYPYYCDVQNPEQDTGEDILNSIGGVVLKSQNIPKSLWDDLNLVKEKDVYRRNKLRVPGHAMAFPALMSGLKIFLGLDSRLESCPNPKKANFLWDWDYYFHLAVSSEGFSTFYDLPHDALVGDYWSGKPLKDCFNAEGIQYHLVANPKIKSRDKVLQKDTIVSEVTFHLDKDLPIILIYEMGPLLLVSGYNKLNSDIVAYPFLDGERNFAFEMQQNSKLYRNWTEDLLGAIFIDGTTDPAPKTGIIYNTLVRGYEILANTEDRKHPYGDYSFGEKLYDTWIKRLLDDSNYQSKKSKKKYVTPEDFELAERRAFTAEFFKDAEDYLWEGALLEAYTAFYDIHNIMLKIHGLISGKNDGNLLKRSTRLSLVSLLKKCSLLDQKAAKNILEVIEHMKSDVQFESK